jgi:3-hydroxyisobutyrate dehydrogenase-like beta-hydroxyacid dehydrogenase
METVGFIGLGNMGGPVAGHIQRAGYPMVVYDLRAEATRPFQARRGRGRVSGGTGSA